MVDSVMKEMKNSPKFGKREIMACQARRGSTVSFIGTTKSKASNVITIAITLSEKVSNLALDIINL